MLDLTISTDDISTMKQGGWAHLQCLNAALHPNHMRSRPGRSTTELLEWTMKQFDPEREP